MKGIIKSPLFLIFFNEIQSIINLILLDIIKIEKNFKKI
jgi:hypothetical protein